MSFLLAMLAVAAEQRVIFTRYESREPTSEQMEAYQKGDKQLLISILPLVDRSELRLRKGQTKHFASGKLNGSATLEPDETGNFLRFDTGKFKAKSPMLLQTCRPLVFYAVRVKAGDKSRIEARAVSIGEAC